LSAIPINKHASKIPFTGTAAPYNGPKIRLNHTVICHVHRDSNIIIIFIYRELVVHVTGTIGQHKSTKSG